MIQECYKNFQRSYGKIDRSSLAKSTHARGDSCTSESQEDTDRGKITSSIEVRQLEEHEEHTVKMTFGESNDSSVGRC